MARYLLTKGRPSVQERSLGKGVPPFSGNLAQLRLRRIGLQGSRRDRVLAVIERCVRGILSLARRPNAFGCLPSAEQLTLSCDRPGRSFHMVDY